MYRFSRFLSDFLLLSAICIFLISILSPLFSANYISFIGWDRPVIRNYSVTYWSYKAVLGAGDEFFLNSYWFNNADPARTSYSGISWNLVAIFFLQLLTLTSGTFSLLKMRNIRIVPLISSLIMLFLMIQAYVKANKGLTINNLELGYLLMYPTIFLFLFALIFHLYSKREKTRHKPARPLAQ
jgi:hypothetical protein